MTFDEVYAKLNERQKEAVDTTQGPVMVVAGPGTGKTQLLATRVANILLQDSTLLPSNILCLTFTESGQIAMQRRLIELMGETGAHVAVHTFHSFGTEIINSFPKYFYLGASYTPADDLTTHEILMDIFNDLPHKNPLATKNLDDFVYLKAVKDRIADLKKSALEPKELRELAMDGLKFVDFIEPDLVKTFDVARFTSQKDIDNTLDLLQKANIYNQPKLSVPGFIPLSKHFIDTLTLSTDEARISGKAQPINLWKKDWFAKDNHGRAICKQRDILDKLLALSEVYENYQAELDKRRLFDYDDMIMRVVHALEKQSDLCFELQEQYQYFLIDEFQDTNAGQMRLLSALANHPVNEGRPNVLVVGDDDQAIYAFQGAELSNILGFKDSYKDVTTITLTDNYRSSQQILEVSKCLIRQGVDRLENLIENLDKTLLAKNPPADTNLRRCLFTNQSHEFEWVAEEICNLLRTGHQPKEIAVICREHKYLENLLPYLYDKQIPVAYERRQSALNQPQILEIIGLAKLIHYLARQDLESANGLMPEVLSADYWQLPAEKIWDLSLKADRHWREKHSSIYWLEIMLKGEAGKDLQQIGKFLLESAKYSKNHSLEETLDYLTGNSSSNFLDNPEEEFDEPKKTTIKKIASPFKDYYFNDDLLKNNPDKYINLLSALAAVRNALRRYKTDQKLSLGDFVYFVELCKQAKVVINVTGLHGIIENSINVMTAHGCKGLEFETVFILSAVNKVWDFKPRGSLLPLSPNLQNIAHSDNPDDRLRLFYVAMTRAKKNLYISGYLAGDDGKEVTSFGALEDSNLQSFLPSPSEPEILPDTAESRLRRVERQWFDKHWQLQSKTMHEILSAKLDSYALSVTHLNNFLDVKNGGPINFLLGNLLQFPAALSPSAAFGSAVHDSLDFAFKSYKANSTIISQNDLIEYFKLSLKHRRLNDKDEKLFLAKGENTIKEFLSQQAETFCQEQNSEVGFGHQGVMIGPARLTGRLDWLKVTGKQAIAIDFKTGKCLKDWSNRSKNDYEKIKLHKYRQQLLFYKLLVDNSRNYGDKGIKLIHGRLVFVEPNKDNDIIALNLDYDGLEPEIERLKALIKSVWRKIIELDFPNIEQFEPSEKGITDFENWLIEN